METPSTPRSARSFLPYVAGAIAVIVLLFLAPMAAELYVEFRWFRSVGFGELFSTVLETELLLGLIIGVLVTLVLYANGRVALHLTRGLGGLRIPDPTGTREVRIAPHVGRLVLPVSLFFGFVFGLVGSDHWVTWLRWLHASTFGTNDPLLGYDVGFYVFELPGLEAICSLGLWLLGLSLAFSAGIHLLRGGLETGPRGVQAKRGTRIHLSVLGALVFLVLAFDTWLAIPQLLFGDLGPVAGASYADVHARLPALRVQIVAAVLAAILIGVSATRKRLVMLYAGIGLFVGVELLGVRLYPALVHRFSVVPNEAVKEAPFIEHNIEATRQAYRLDGVEERDLSAEVSLTWQDIQNNQATIENVRLWDHQPLLDTFAQIQEIRTYYEFASVDNDRYVIDGKLRQMMLSPRELSAESLPNRTWINEHFTFTHGYGLTLGPVNAATEEGLPVLFIKDIPPVSELDRLQVTRPGIYFGEMSNDYVFVRTKANEFDYPSGEDNVYAEYEGPAGVHLDGMLMRLAVALRTGSFKIVLSDDIDEDSRILLNRNIRDRVRTLAPFLRFDSDPYMVVRDDGTLVWIYDAYTTSTRYPYAQPSGANLNYVRNSVKVMIDAYTGAVTFYTADPDDPVLLTWRRIFPQTFTPMSEMPADIRRHLRYPEDIFSIQTEMFTTYQMESAELVYNREDQWEIPTIRKAGNVERMVPYYTVMRLPGEDDAEFIQMLPFTPKRKDNLAAWMVARMDGDKLGDLVVYRFPKDRLVFGPQQVMNRINQDADISRQISLWDQRGSSAIMGTLLVIPIEEALLYVTPLYLRSEGGRIPELKRVIVAYENSIAMEPTLEGALEALFVDEMRSEAAQAEAVAESAREAVPDRPTADETLADEAAAADAEPAEEEAPTDPSGLARQARRHYEEALERQRAGDWAGYGEELEKLEQVLQRLAPGN